jgi:hypothetical protein
MMSEKVVCINDKNLPEGAEVVEGKEYTVLEIEGINNKGRTKMGLAWLGYRAERFKNANSMMDVIMEEEQMFQLN